MKDEPLLEKQGVARLIGRSHVRVQVAAPRRLVGQPPRQRLFIPDLRTPTGIIPA